MPHLGAKCSLKSSSTQAGKQAMLILVQEDSEMDDMLGQAKINRSEA